MTDRIADTSVFVVDCQSTGATPAQGQVLEMGWAWHEPEVEAPKVAAALVALAEGARLSRMTRELTGLSPADLEHAAQPEEVWAALWAAMTAHGPPPVRTVIHFAQFERRFLEDWSERFGGGQTFPLEIVCTHDIARRLLPDLPRRGLRALAGYFGFSATTLRRSADHVAATAFVWRHLVERLAEQGVRTWAELDAWRAQAAPKRSKKKRYPMPRDKRLGLPPKPGVYRFLRTNGDVLYVGKATSLKHRVNSHFTKQAGLSDRVLEMLSQARDLEATVCESPLEAAVLETDEIKRHNPPYNVALLDEKRQVAFARRDLSAIAEAPDPDHPVGPLGSRFAVAALPTMQKLLVSPDAARDARGFTGARALGIMPVSAPEQDIFRQGLEAFAEANDLTLGAPVEVGPLLGLGRRLFLAQQAVPRPKRVEDEVVWDPERVREHLEIALGRVAQHVQRARWLRRLVAASVGFREPNTEQERWLRLEAGRIVEQGFLDPGAALPVGSEAEGVAFDMSSYDRLRVLVTELKRVVRDGGHVRVRFGAGRTLQGPALVRALTMV